MGTISISREEYQELKAVAEKIKLIDKTIHEDLTTREILKAQEKQKVFSFLSDPREDIYTEADVKKK